MKGCEILVRTYRYQFKKAEYRKTQNLQDYQQTIKGSITDVLGIPEPDIKVYPDYFEFTMGRTVNIGVLQTLGKAIVARDEKLNSMKTKYPCSNQMFTCVNENTYYGFLDMVYKK